MKNVLLLFTTFCLSTLSQAQIKTPQPSPHASVQQTVGLTTIKIDYSRPSMRGRSIFCDLLPYGQKWRTGANENTTISFSTPVTFNGQELKAGTYALYTLPGKDEWQVMFYKDTSNWGLPENWDAQKVALKMSVKPTTLSQDIETFTISIDELSMQGAKLNIMWEKTLLSIPFSVPTDKMVTADIDRVMNGPGANDYYSAAVYYLEADKDIDKAKQWIDKAIQMTDEPKFYQYRQKALIYAKSGEEQKAVKAAKRSMELAQKAGNDDYVRMNKKSLKEWGAM